jgi:hypothetical protein
MEQELTNTVNRRRVTIRVCRDALSFAMPQVADDGTQSILYEPYVVKSGISMAANLREAFKTADLLANDLKRARVLADVPTLMVPVELFEEATMEELYRHAYHEQGNDVVLYNVLPDLNAVAVFAVNRDLKTVLDDHFSDIQFITALSPVWRHLHQRSFTGIRNKLYGYFHDKKLDIFTFQKNRFKFCNQYEAKHYHNALYFLLYVWNQLMLDAEHDEMHLVGDMEEADELMEELRRYVQKAYVINPTADFNRAPATQVKGMPYDLMTLFTKGR